LSQFLKKEMPMPSRPRNIEIIEADLALPEHADAMKLLLSEYALDPMGGGEPIPDETLERLPRVLAQRPGSYTLLAYVEGQPAGLLNAFEGFSTFACAPILNIHDIVVTRSLRGYKLADHLLEAAEGIAHRIAACKMTLEVLEGNTRAQTVYRRCGFEGYELDPATGKALFWQKKLTAPSLQ
jgi:ribosomal protein S18 acetylase RimI-like enzyme